MKKLGIGKILLIDGIVVVAAFLFTLMVNSGNPIGSIHYYIDMPSIIIVLLFALPPFFASGMWKYFIRAFSIGKKDYTVAEIKQSLEAVGMLQKLFLIAGCFSCFINIVAVMRRMDEPMTIGPHLALVVLSGLVVTIFEFFLLPVKTHVQMALIQKMNLEEEIVNPGDAAEPKEEKEYEEK